METPAGNLLEIRTFGGLILECSGRPIAGIVSRKAEALLVYLACTGRPHSREVLAELLWPERSQSQSLANLRSGLSNLRQVLPSHVHITRRVVSLLEGSPCWLDVGEFEHLIALAGIRERHETVLSHDEASMLTKALDLYRGDFLQGFFIPDSRAFEDWAELERERLRRIVIEALHYLVLYDLQHGAYVDGIAQATRLLSLDPLHEEINRHLILLLAQAGQRTQALAQYEAYCRLLDEELGAKPSSDLVALYRQIQSGAPTRPLEAPDRPPMPAPVNPYKGLRPFQEADAEDFFGREASVQRLLARLRETQFLAVVGPSGSGKSSLVRAGLIPALRRGALPNSERWQIVTILVGAHPTEELATALRRLGPQLDVTLWDSLERDPRGLLRIAKRLLPEDLQAELLLVIDQFEEVFSLVADEEARRHFLQSLLTALSEPHSRLRVIVTLRADFYDRPLLYPELGELVQQWTEVVLPLTPAELERAIVGPAEHVGVEVEPAVVNEIIADVNKQPGALPLLQYALTELFEHRAGLKLTLEGYRVSGGVHGALAARANKLYESLGAEVQQTCRQVFLRLVQLGVGAEDTRQRVSWAEIVAVSGSEAKAHALVDPFVKNRLLTLDHDPVARCATVELAHEALIREWLQLSTWLDENRADLRQQRMLAAATDEWRAEGRDRSYLLSGSRLAQFENWSAEANVALTADEADFLNTSLAERRRQRTRRRWTRNAALAVATTVAVVMTVLALVALKARSTAQQQRDQATREAAVNRSLVLANAAANLADAEGPSYALPLALEAVAMNRPPQEAINTLQNIARQAGTVVVLRDKGNLTRAVAFSPDSRLGLSGGCATLENQVCTEGELALWDLAARSEMRRFVGHSDWVNGVAFSPDGKTILSASDDWTLILWDVETGAIIRRLEGHTGAVKSMALSLDGQTAISGSADGTLRIWDVNSGETVHRLEGYAAIVKEVGLSPDGQVAASYTDDSLIILWDVATGQEIRRLDGHHTSAISAINFRPITTNEYRLFVSAMDNRFVEWDVDTGQISRQFAAGSYGYRVPISADGRAGLILFPAGPCLFDMEQFQFIQCLYDRLGGAEAAAISPDGHNILIGHMNGVLRLCDMPASAEVRRFQAEVPLVSVDVSPDGRSLLTGALTGGVAILWDVQTGQEIRRFEGLEAATWQVEFSPDGQLAALGSSNTFDEGTKVKVVVVDIATGQEIHRLEGHKFPFRSMAFSPDGHYLLTGTMQYTPEWPVVGGGELFLWDVETGTMVRRFEETKAVMGIEFSPDGRQVVTGSDLAGGYLSLWDVSTGQLIRRFYDWAAVNNCPDEALWEPDGVHILVSGLGGVVEMNLETGEATRVFHGPSAATIMFLDHSPDWRYVVGTDISTPGNLIVWDFATGREIHHFAPYNAAGWNVVFSPQGQTVFASSIGDNWVGEWQVGDWPLDDLLAWVQENRYVREFTCEERVQYRIEPLCE